MPITKSVRVVQCWDDGVEDDIRLAEILRRHGARASFNLNPGLHGVARGQAWSYRNGLKQVRKLAQAELVEVYAGFTIANHSLTHPHATRIPLERWRSEVIDARARLQDWFGQPVDGFVYPYGDFDAATAEVVREAGHLYARATGSATPCLPVADKMVLRPDCHAMAEDFWTRYEQAKASPAGVFYFWGHSYELVTGEQWAEFEAKIARIAADPAADWAELPDVMRGA